MELKYYLVGGACRDMLMNITPKDYDFVVVGTNPQYFIDKQWKLVGQDFPVFLEPTHGWEVALTRVERKIGSGYTGFETEWNGVTLEEDLSRRDLTINSISIEVDWEATVRLGEPVTIGGWIDPFNGVQDIQDKVLCPTTEAFKEDPIRLLRAARFFSRYGDFTASPQLIKQCQELESSGELEHLVPERVWLETEKALKEKYPQQYFSTLLNFNFPFTEVFRDMWNTVENNPYHREPNVFIHTMMVLEHAANTWNDSEINFASLLHDISKHKCYKERGNGHGHDGEGVQMIEDWCKKWKVPNNYRDLAKITCEQHQKVHSSMGRDTNSWSRPKSLMKILEQTSALSKPERFKKMLKVCESDNYGRISDVPKGDYPQRQYLEECLEAIISLDTKSISSKLLEQGKDGKIIGLEIRSARINEIRKVQKKWKQKLKENENGK